MESLEYPGQPGRLIPFLVVALVLFFAIIAFSPTTRAATGVRFLHLSPDAGPVDIWIDGRLVEQELTFKEDTDYVEINPDQHRIICKTEDGPDTVVLNSLFPFREDKQYTVALTGDRMSDDLQLLFVIDNCPPTQRLAQVKFTNAIQNSPQADLSIKYGPVLYSRVSFRTGGGCRLIPPDSYLFSLTESESGDLIAQKELELQAETRYNIFTTRSQEDGGIEFLSLSKPNAPEEVPKIFGVERSVLQLLGAGLIASLVILVLGR
ncbi:MAG: DUF4397 domain-containing protein [Candidatus Bipolaricaulota bacterium]|nr:DUF4397 domain-containing protein [Candidatus Bipolaricaulota bacterium]MBS3792703.1 DUF4397 domain-containing protein [Candidatus Bipolaricaulota bacterium]